MAETAAQPGKLDVFISYSRADLAFADQLDATLRIGGFDTKLDRHGIHGGENWRERLGTLIRESDTVVFVLSAASAGSEICAWEVGEAVRLGKRILPVLPGPLGEATVPAPLSALNYVHLYAEPKRPGSGFGPGLVELVAALNTDLGWLREHTRLMQWATLWEAGGRATNRLLSGADIAAAKAWAARTPKDAPAPTPLHLEFIRSSEQVAELEMSEERRRLDEMAAAQLAREGAINDKEQAQRQRSRLQRLLMGGSVATAVGFGAFGVYSWSLRQQAVAAREVSDNARVSAETAKAQAVASQKELAIRVDDLRAANVRLDRKLALRIAPYGNQVQRIPDTWLRVATDLTGAVATVVRQGDRGAPVGTGFIVRGGALHEPWGDETLLVTASFVFDRVTSGAAVRDGRASQAAPGRVTPTTAAVRFFADGCLLHISALTYASLLSLVPFLALMFAALKGLGVQRRLESILLSQLGLTEEVTEKLLTYIERTNFSALGVAGGISLVLTVLSVLSQIELSFNHIWRVRRGRAWYRRLSDYLSSLFLPPFILLAAVTLSSYLKEQGMIRLILHTE